MSDDLQLGYLGIEASDLGAWESFATEVLGLAVGRRHDDGSLGLRMDEHQQRLLLHPGSSDDLAYLGWQAPTERALDQVAERLASAGVAVSEAKPEVTAVRGVARLIQSEDPSGIPLEVCCSPRIDRTPFRSSELLSGFVTGEGGLGHVVITASDHDASLDFYTRVLGLRLSDQIRLTPNPEVDVTISFLHANPRHHSVAFANVPMGKRIHHFMLEVEAMDDVGRGYDRARDAGVTIAQELGRHTNDRMFSFYGQTPSGFQFEFGWGGVRVDDASWRTRTYDTGSEWGHRLPS